MTISPIDSPDLPSPEKDLTGWPWTRHRSSQPKINKEKPWPKISIITPSYNQGAYIEETIRSVLLQGYPNLEYIVIDGGSTDNTLEILKKYEQYLAWISEPDNGQTDAINKGLKIATGEILAYLNSDDIYEPGAFFEVSSFFMDHPEVGMTYGNLFHIDKSSRVVEEIKCKKKCNLAGLLSFNFYIAQPTVFFRRDVMERIGFFDENLDLMMDLDYWLRAAREVKIGFIDRHIAAFRIYPDAKSTAQDLSYFDEFFYIFNKMYSQLPATGYLKYKNKSLGQIYLNMARINLPRGNIEEAKRLFLKSFKTYPRNFLSLKNMTSFLSVFLGKEAVLRIIAMKRKFRKIQYN